MGNLKPIDSALVKDVDYDLISPDTVGGEYIETIGAACENPDGYTSGSLFLGRENGVQHLYRATAAIALGETIILDNNCVYTTVSGELEGKAAEISSLNEALTNEIATTTANGAHNFFGGKFTSYTEDGLIITANADGSVSVSGSKATASNMNVDSTNFVLKAGTYIFGKNPMPASGIVNGKTNMSVLIVPGNNHISPLPLDADEEKVFTLAQDTTVKVRVYCYCTVAGTSFNVTFKPLIRLVTDSSDVYTPYAKTNRELTEKLDGKHVTSKFLNTTNTIVTADGVKTRSQLLNELAAKFLAVVQALPNGQQARLMKMDGNAIGTDLTPIRKIVYDNSATSVVEEFNKINYDGSNFRLYHVFLNGTSPRACYANYNGTNWALNDMITGVPTNGNVIRLYYDIYSRV